jgi:hypothetical protein
MKHHEREFFIYMIRSGKIYIEKDNTTLIIHPPTIDQSFEASLIYDKAYKQAMIDGIMSEDEINEWMLESGLWSLDKDKKSDGFKQDLEKLKIEIYNNRSDSKLREKIRLYIRSGEKQYAEHLREKTQYYQNSREGYALSEKVSWIIKNCTYKNNKLYDFKDISLSYVIDEWQNSILSESIIRELAREEPWKSLWSIRENIGIKLFNNTDGQELTQNQKHLITWSQVYDNIQESIDCPTEEVIKDDDLLDGWFIVQSKKREKERLEKDFESKTQNEKIKNSSEIYVMADRNDPNSINKINQLNDAHAKAIKQQRFDIIKQKDGTVRQHDFLDEKRKMQMDITNMMRNNVKGGNR